jgi:hypothetical protein
MQPSTVTRVAPLRIIRRGAANATTAVVDSADWITRGRGGTAGAAAGADRSPPAASPSRMNSILERGNMFSA